MPKPYNVGVTAGKFYPPHMGHHGLIDELSSQCDVGYVLVVYRHDEKPDIDLRLKWLETEHAGQGNLVFIPVSDIPGHDDDSVAWARYTREVLPEGIAIDAVFTSENYGDTWAAELGCKHVQFDLARESWPVSGTAVRLDPYSNWEYLGWDARQYYAMRVCIVGGESVGKSTMTERLAKYFRTKSVEEYGRTYVERHGVDPKDPVIWPAILHNQPRLEDEAAYASNGLVFCDTDLITTMIWYERWVHDGKQLSAEKDPMYWAIYREAARRRYDLYILLHHEDTDWVQDGTRTESEHRAWFTNRIKEELLFHACPLREIKGGTWDEKFEEAKNYVFSKWKMPR